MFLEANYYRAQAVYKDERVVHHQRAVVVGFQEHLQEVGKFGVVVGHHHGGLLAGRLGGNGLLQGRL